MNKLRSSMVAAMISVIGFSVPVLAVVEPVYFPANNQTTEQMNQDKIYCQGWAQEQTKQSDTANSEVKKEGSAVRGAARTAAAGAMIGGAAGSAGKGAAVGAAVGGVSGRRRANQAEAAQKKATADYYYRSLSACMQGKGYTAQ